MKDVAEKEWYQENISASRNEYRNGREAKEKKDVWLANIEMGGH